MRKLTFYLAMGFVGLAGVSAVLRPQSVVRRAGISPRSAPAEESATVPLVKALETAPTDLHPNSVTEREIPIPEDVRHDPQLLCATILGLSEPDFLRLIRDQRTYWELVFPQIFLAGPTPFVLAFEARVLHAVKIDAPSEVKQDLARYRDWFLNLSDEKLHLAMLERRAWTEFCERVRRELPGEAWKGYIGRVEKRQKEMEERRVG